MAETPKKEPTAAEAMLFFSIVKHTRNKADVDWEGVAQEAGFKNAEVAKVPPLFYPISSSKLTHIQVRFGQVKRKLGISTETTSTSRTTPRKATANAASPSKVVKTPRAGAARGKGKAKAKVKKEEELDDNDGLGDAPSPVTYDPPGTYAGVKIEQEEADHQLHDELNTSFKFDQPDPFANHGF